MHASRTDSTPRRPAITLPHLRAMAARGEKIAMLTCYDATFARALDAAQVDVLLVGDSLGNVIQGEASTLPVSLEHMVYHTRCVARSAPSAFVISDLPFGTYEDTPHQAFASATELLRAGAQMVKLEGAGPHIETVRHLVERGVSVCAHLGLTPQRVHALGGFRVQGRDTATAAQLMADAQALAQAGAALLVLELIPADLAQSMTQAMPEVPTIGIGAGPDTAGQVLVLHDALGLPGASAPTPRFVRDFTRDPESGAECTIHTALARYVRDVKSGHFPVRGIHTF
jgi:3-methyl-2-oxobutanoate hydroxymethyltransferase